MSKIGIVISCLMIGFFIRPWVEVIGTILSNAWKEYLKGKQNKDE